MAEDDIYGSRSKYEQFKSQLDMLLIEPAAGGARKYYCKNPENIRYFKLLFQHFEARDLSYIRRHRLLQSMRLICHLTSRNLAECTRDDINEMVATMHTIYKKDPHAVHEPT
ncbi:MAG: hypothetical protein HY459_01350 [Parcubacteria group bacterium]|nr:hypothetical protein [Parcubacteria group bacterium]